MTRRSSTTFSFFFLRFFFGNGMSCTGGTFSLSSDRRSRKREYRFHTCVNHQNTWLGVASAKSHGWAVTHDVGAPAFVRP